MSCGTSYSQEDSKTLGCVRVCMCDDMKRSQQNKNRSFSAYWWMLIGVCVYGGMIPQGMQQPKAK